MNNKKQEPEAIMLMGKAIKVEKSFPKVFCSIPTGTRGSNTAHPYNTIEVKFNDVFYDFKLLESGSVIYKQKEKDKNYFVSAFGIMFSPVKEKDPKTDKKIKRVKEIESEVSKLLTERNKILKSLGKCDDRVINF